MIGQLRKKNKSENFMAVASMQADAQLDGLSEDTSNMNMVFGECARYDQTTVTKCSLKEHILLNKQFKVTLRKDFCLEIYRCDGSNKRMTSLCHH